MKPLTIEELKSLEVGDWVWIELQYETGFYALVERRENDYIEFNSAKRRGFIAWYNYGTKWLAFKNKEQAEAKGEIVELPCNVGDYVYIIDNDRHWAKIDTIRIYDEHNGKQKIVYKWAQYDVGVDITELWDEGEFDSEEIGKTILLEKEHDEKIKELIDAENKKFEAWEQECERRRQELRGEK